MHALVVEVDIDTDRTDEAVKLLHEQVVPAVTSTPGLVTAYWMGAPESGKGASFAIYESEEAARAARENAPRAPEGGPVTVTRFDLMPVLAQA